MNLEKIRPYLDKRSALQHAIGMLSLDSSTVGLQEGVAKQMESMQWLTRELIEMINSIEYQEVIHELESDSELSFEEKKMVEEWVKEIKEQNLVPIELSMKYQKACNDASSIWPSLKHQDDWDSFVPYLEEVIKYKKEIADLNKKPEESRYDYLLKRELDGFTSTILNTFFAELKQAIVPLLERVRNADKIDDQCMRQEFPIAIQEEYVRELVGRLGFDFNRGDVAKSEHPFTTSFSTYDVRFTNHFYADNLSSISSGMHEAGHALYEMGINPNYNKTPLATGTSAQMHEGQSRFYENMIGRSLDFWRQEYPYLQQKFMKQLSDVDVETFYRALNVVQAGEIRIEADELTYCLHIMLRYEIEKAIMDEDFAISELPKYWNQLMQQYLGVQVVSNQLGVLQDMHWSVGLIGYFPGYALGSAIAAQQAYHLTKTIKLPELIQAQDYQAIYAYLCDHVYQYGKCYNTDELLLKMTSEKFDAKYYIEYLTKKYTELYNL